MDPWTILGWILVAAFTPVALVAIVLVLGVLISVIEGVHREWIRKRAERERVREAQERIRVREEEEDMLRSKFDALLRDRDGL